MGGSSCKECLFINESFIIFYFCIDFIESQCYNLQENQKERITIQVKNQPIQKVFDDLSKQTGLKFFYGEAIANRNVQVNLKFKNAPINKRIEPRSPGKPIFILSERITR